MRGEWNGLQALILQECPYAYYVHCLAHQLQLALVAASKDSSDVHAFFQNLSRIVNVVCSSCKRNDELHDAYETEIARLVANDEIETGRGANQIGTLQRPGDTRWSSHFNSICSLLRMFNATTSVLEDLVVNGTGSQRATTERAFSAMKIIKTSLRNKMEDGFLTDYMIVYIEKEIARRFTTDMIIDDFYFMKQRRAQLKK
ncbi:uncharacterized protein LOC109810428 [Cajanus cajan]|uniref:uncharacterized protein LOC109810428 n=1 Tax=Cajanus cajan TaxID=3821 RepID=UPI00098DB80A|nr:uncharacterized protein LOC109810428 [Cajanus cajan]